MLRRTTDETEVNFLRWFPWCRAIRMYRVIEVLGILPELRTRVNLSLPEQVFLYECKGYKRLKNLSRRTLLSKSTDEPAAVQKNSVNRVPSYIAATQTCALYISSG